MQGEDKYLKSVRKQTVAKRTDFIQKSRYSLTNVENKAVLYILSKVQPDDEPGKRYRFYFNEFYKVINWKKATYNDLKMLLQRIADSSVWIEMPDGRETLLRWFDIVDTDSRGKGYFEITFHRRMYPFVNELPRQKRENSSMHYLTFELEKVSLMKHRYSAPIYELLKSYQINNRKWIFEIGTGSKHDLQLMISEVDSRNRIHTPASWSNYAIFNRDVLSHAKDEINRYTDIKIEYEPMKIDLSGKKHRKYCAIEFYMLEKSVSEKELAESIIDAEYREIETEEDYRQLTIEETFFQEDVQKRKREEEEKEEARREEIVNASKYPMIKEAYPEFSEEEISLLIRESLNHVLGLVKFDAREIWAYEYVAHYYDYIAATPQDTKTTFFKRLLDMVRNDYDGVALRDSVWFKADAGK